MEQVNPKMSKGPFVSRLVCALVVQTTNERTIELLNKWLGKAVC